MHISTKAEQLLGPDGPFAEQNPAFKARLGQQEMAEIIQRAIDNTQNCVIEAPSGLGKTWAYLVPLLLCNKRSIISTAGHYLQSQLLNRDIPEVQKYLGLSRSVALLKGRQNYLCPYFVKKHIASEGRQTLSLRIKSQLSLLLQNFRETGNGDLDTLKLEAALLPFVSCASEECISQACPDYKRCPLMKAQKKAAYADIVIINHSLLLSLNIADKNNFLFNTENILVDEAHNLLDFAQQISGNRVSSRQLYWFFSSLSKCIQQYTAEDTSICQFIEKTQQWFTLIPGYLPTDINYDRQQHENIVQQLIQVLKQLNTWFSIAKERAYELYLLSLQSERLLAALQSIKDDEGLCWVHSQGRGFMLQNIPVNALDKLRQLFEQSPQKTWLLTSATFSATPADSFNNMASSDNSLLTRLGLASNYFHRLASPFELDKKARIYLGAVDLLPQQANYYSQFCQQLAAFTALCPGRVLVLFSSHRALVECKKQLCLGDQRQILFQGNKTEHRVNNYALVDSFRRDKTAILLATGAFWEGLDLAGAPLSAVVIDKLPFSSPADPLVKLRSAYLERHGVDCFNEFMLPQAIIKLRQGCGRLLRREGDKGVIMLADPRLRSKSYGQAFIESLGPIPHCKNLAEVDRFFNENK